MPRRTTSTSKEPVIDKETGFSQFYEQERKHILESENKKYSNNQVLKLVRDKWDMLSNKEKQTYQKQQKYKNNEEHLVLQAEQSAQKILEEQKQKQSKAVTGIMQTLQKIQEKNQKRSASKTPIKAESVKKEVIAISDQEGQKKKLKKVRGNSQQNGRKDSEKIYHEEGEISNDQQGDLLQDFLQKKIQNNQSKFGLKNRKLDVQSQEKELREKISKNKEAIKQGLKQQKQQIEENEKVLLQQLREEQAEQMQKVNSQNPIQLLEEEQDEDEMFQDAKDFQRIQQTTTQHNNKKNMISELQESDDELYELVPKQKLKIQKEPRQKNVNRTHSAYIQFFRDTYSTLKDRFKNRTSQELSKAASLEWQRYKKITRNKHVQQKLDQQMEQQQKKNQIRQKKYIGKKFIIHDGIEVMLPKKPLRTYLMFYVETRQKILQEYEDMQNTDISQKCAQMWKELPQSQKDVYQRRYDQEMLKYENEKIKFSNKYGYSFVKEKQPSKPRAPRPPRPSKSSTLKQHTPQKIQPVFQLLNTEISLDLFQESLVANI